MNKLDFQRVGPPKKEYLPSQATHAEQVQLAASMYELIEQQSKEIAELKALAKKMADALCEAVAGMGGSYAIWSPKAEESLSAYRERIKE